MASAEASAPLTDSAPSDIPSAPKQEAQTAQSQQVSSTPIEMHSLSASSQPEQEHTSLFGPNPIQSGPTHQSATEDAVTAAGSQNRQIESQTTPNSLNFDPHGQESLSSAPANNASAETHPSQPRLTRMDTAPAIGPATDKPTSMIKDASEGPVLFITLLLASTGARHPYKLDGKYLKRRNVEVEGNNPINMKWDAKPSSPESIRLIFMGKMLNDKSRLTDNGFTTGLTPQIVHMAIKPQEIVDEEEANKAIGKDREGHERSPGCRCVIQ